MGDTIQLEAGAKAAWDVVSLDYYPYRKTGPGAEVYLGVDFKLNPDDKTQGMLLLSGSGLVHNSDAGQFFAATPELGLGLKHKKFFLRLMGGPLWTDSTPDVGGTGRIDIGILLGEHIAFTIGPRYMYLPQMGTVTETRTDIVVTDPTRGEIDFVEHEMTRHPSVEIMRYFLGLEIPIF